MSSSLRDRLRGIVGGAVPRVAPELLEPQPATEPWRPAAADPAGDGAPEDRAEAAAAVLGGTVSLQAEGPVVVVDRHYAASDRHGRTAIGEIVETLLERTEALDLLARVWCTRPPGAPAPGVMAGASEEPRSATLWFLDLETTGLAGGAGTQAFLVGCAGLSEDGIAVRQFLLPGFEHERALLSEVAAWAAARGAVVTFNGKSFDLPLIETRYLFHRVPFPMDGVPHVDMLHPARRLWRARGSHAGGVEASCSLGTLERLLAGVHRVGDVPGFEIPARYFQFVRDGNARPLEAVLEHNRLDLVSLALVMARVLALIDRGPEAAADAYECLGLARVYDRAGRADEADASYLRAIDGLERVGRDPETCADALRRLAWCRRRAGRLHEAAETWQRLADLPGCPAALRRDAREALAIYHEHRARDLDAARVHAEHLLDVEGNARRRLDAEHRLRRIQRKMAGRAETGLLWSAGRGRS